MNFIFLPPFHFDIATGAKHPGNKGSDDGIAERTTYLIQLGALAVKMVLCGGQSRKVAE